MASLLLLETGGTDNLLLETSDALLLDEAGTAYSQSLASTVALADSLSQKLLNVGAPDAVAISDSLGITFPRAFTGSVSVSDRMQLARSRGQSTTELPWRNPPRLAQTLWTLVGSNCPCGLGHVGPQGCNGDTPANLSEPLSLSDALTIALSSSGTPLIVAGWEEGEAVSHFTGADAFASYVFSSIAPYLTTAPLTKTDHFLGGSRSIQFGIASGPGSAFGFYKDLAVSLIPPFTVSCKFYFYLVATDATNAVFDLFELVAGVGRVRFGIKSISSSTAQFQLENLNATGDPKTQSGTVLATGTWYRATMTVTVAADSDAWTQTATVYTQDSLTALATVSQSGTGWGAGSENVTQVKLGDVFDIQTTWDVRMEDLVVEKDQAVSVGPYRLVMIQPNTDVSTQWTKLGSSPAATNALNVAGLPASYADVAVKFNQATTSGLSDRFGIDISGVPSGKGLSRLILYARGSWGTNFGFKLRVWDDDGVLTEGPTVNSIDGESLPTSGLLVMDIRGYNRADLANFNIGYVSAGASSSSRQISNLWGYVEYDPT